MSKQTPNWREIIIEVLGILASEEEQLTLEKNMPALDIMPVVVNMWYGQYHPNDAGVNSCFTPDELTALAEFHRFFNERYQKLPERRSTVRNWLVSPIWRAVMRKAHETASVIENKKTVQQPDPDAENRAKKFAAMLEKPPLLPDPVFPKASYLHDFAMNFFSQLILGWQKPELVKQITFCGGNCQESCLEWAG